jgi:ribonuclease M5
MPLIRCSLPIVVEGKYDKLALQRILDATIIETGGFSLYRNREKLELLRTLAKQTGLVVLTDSDAAGFQIRNFIKSAIPDGRMIHVYIPDVFGKERRKAAPSKEGKLGVEGMDPQLLLHCLENAGVFAEPVSAPKPLITKADFFEAGLSGTENAAQRRSALLKKLQLPQRMSVNVLLAVLNTLYSKEEFFNIINDL